MPTKTKTKAVTDKPKREYPRLPIFGRISIGSEGKDFQHGIGAIATGDPETNQPRISIGNIWYPEDGGERHPAFMRHTSTLILEDAEAFAEDLAKAVKAARKGDFLVAKPKREAAKPASTAAAPQQDAAVADLVRQQVIATFIKMGMTQQQAEAAYTESQEAKGNEEI